MEKNEIQALYEKYASLLYRRAFHILKNEQSAKEILQDVFVNIINKSHQFRGEGSPYGWLYTMTTRMCLNFIKKSGRTVLTDFSDFDEPAQDPRSAKNAKIDVNRFVAKLDTKSKQIFIYHHYDRLKQEEIAELTGFTRKTVYLKLKKIKDRMEKFFNQTT